MSSICWRCNGEGMVPDNHGEVEGYRTCRVCGGTGVDHIEDGDTAPGEGQKEGGE